MSIAERIINHLRKEGVIATIVAIKTHIVNKFVNYIARVFLYLGEYVIKPKNVVLFGTKSFGNIKQDSHYMYEWVIESHPDVDAFWVAHTQKEYRELKHEGKPVVYSKSVRGLLILLKANVAITSRGKESIAFDKKIVPDRITRMRISDIPFQLSKHRNPNPDDFDDDYRLVSSEFEIGVRQKKRPYVMSEYKITGKPSNDIIISPPADAKSALEDFFARKGISDDQTVILYGPTRRSIYNSDERNVNFFPFDDLDTVHLAEMLEAKDIILLLRPHYKDEIRMDERDSKEYREMSSYLDGLLASSPNVMSAYPSEFSDTNVLLHSVDILLTDYSSIWHEFLLLNRPIIFMPYDVAKFDDHAGAVYNYREMTPGPKVQSFEEWVSHIETLCAGEDPCREERQEVRDRFHKYTDDQARERIMELVEKELGR